MKKNRIHVALASLLCTILFGAVLGTLFTVSGVSNSTTGTEIMQYVFIGGFVYIAAVGICIYGAPEKDFKSLSGSYGALWLALILTLALLIAINSEAKTITVSAMIGIWTMRCTVNYLKKKWISV